MSMKFQELIDKENMLLDRKRLADFNKNAGKRRLLSKIDEIRDSLLEDVNNSDIATFTLVYRLTEKIKDII